VYCAGIVKPIPASPSCRSLLVSDGESEGEWLGVASQPLLAAAHYALLLAPTALVVRRAESEAARRGGGAKPKEL